MTRTFESGKTFEYGAFLTLCNRLATVLITVAALMLTPNSSVNFRSSCDRLNVYLADHKTLLSAGDVLTVEQKNRVTSIIDLLAGLQKRAETRANIPASLQKYIAEQSD